MSVVIPTRGSRGRIWGVERIFVHDAVASLLADSDDRCELEIIAVVDAGTDDLVERGLRRIAGDRLRVVAYDAPFNFSDKINRGVAAARGEFVLLLNDDTELVTSGSVAEMVGLAQQEDVGMVGAKLLFEDGTLQHGGHLYHGTISHALLGWPGDHPGPHRMLAVERECAGVTAAAALLRRSVFNRVGGMNTDLAVNYNDVDLSLTLRASGHRIVWTPARVLVPLRTADLRASGRRRRDHGDPAPMGRRDADRSVFEPESRPRPDRLARAPAALGGPAVRAAGRRPDLLGLTRRRRVRRRSRSAQPTADGVADATALVLDTAQHRRAGQLAVRPEVPRPEPDGDLHRSDGRRDVGRDVDEEVATGTMRESLPVEWVGVDPRDVVVEQVELAHGKSPAVRGRQRDAEVTDVDERVVFAGIEADAAQRLDRSAEVEHGPARRGHRHDMADLDSGQVGADLERGEAGHAVLALRGEAVDGHPGLRGGEVAGQARD